MKKLDDYYVKIPFIYSFDIYGVDFSLRYKNKEKFPTKIGIILSIISILGIIIISVKSMIDIFNKNNFSLVSNENKINNFYQIDLNDFPIILGILDSNNIIQNIDESIYKIEAKSELVNIYYENNYRKLNKTYNKIILENCSNNSKLKKQNFFKENISNYLCFQENQDLKFYGKHLNLFEGYSSIEINLKKCSKNCKNDSEIEKKIKNENLILFYLSNKINHYNKSNPINLGFDSLVFSMSNLLTKEFTIFFSPNEYLSDNGILFHSNKKYNFYQFNELSIDLLEKKNDNILKIIFSSSEYQINFKRKYSKIQDTIASIGGIINIIYIICKNIALYFAKKTVLFEITDSLVNEKCKKSCHLISNKKYLNNKNNNNNIDNKIVFEPNIIINSMKNINRLSLKENNLNINHKKFIENNYKCEKYFNKNDNISNKNNSNLFHNNTFSKLIYFESDNENSKIYFEKEEINNEKLQDFFKLNEIKLKNKDEKSNIQKYNFKWYEYFIPHFLLKRMHKYKLLCLYTDIFHSYLSIEHIIPVIERFSKYCKEKPSKLKILGNKNNISNSFRIFNNIK